MSYDGIVFFEGGILGGIIVYASEIAADPYATFSILVEGINGIVRQGIVIVGIVGEVLDFPGFLVVDIYSSFSNGPFIRVSGVRISCAILVKKSILA